VAVEMTQIPVIDWPAFGQARATLGNNFPRILGYFREDGTKAVLEIEDAMRASHAGTMIIPAEKVKSGAFELGAQSLGILAEEIEFGARDCLETRMPPTALLELVIQLRPLFEKTMEQLDRESNPLMDRRAAQRFPNINSYVTRRAS
jgi:hypothetical protein